MLLPVEPMLYFSGMDHDDTAPRPILAGWLGAIDEGNTQLAAGQTVPASVVRAKLRTSIDRLEAAQLEDADWADQP